MSNQPSGPEAEDPKDFLPYPTTELCPIVANQAKLEALCGFRLHPDAFTVRPFGNRMVIVREEVKAYTGTCHLCGKRNLTVSQERKCAYCGAEGLVMLEMPTQARDLPQVGWVISVGPEVTLPQPPRSIPLDAMSLLGCKVLFAVYGGYTLGIGEPGETLYEGRYVIIESTSVFALVGEPPMELVV